MLQKLYFEIAEHCFVVETPDKDLTKKVLSSFRPFLINSVLNINEDYEAQSNYKVSKINKCVKNKFQNNNVLFTFSGNKKILIPKIKPIERMDFEGTEFNVYHVVGGTTISMKMGERIHYMFITSDYKQFSTDLTLTKKDESQFILFLLRAAYGMAAIRQQTIKIHASVTEKNGKALVFLGKSGTGKSTHSRLWREFVPGCRLLNDDEPIIRLHDDGSVRVYGAPWSGSTPCYINDSAEVAAFVHLYQSPENKLTRLSGIESFTSMFQSSALLRSDKKGREASFNLITEILSKVPYYRLDNRPDREAVSLTETLI